MRPRWALNNFSVLGIGRCFEDHCVFPTGFYSALALTVATAKNVASQRYDVLESTAGRWNGNHELPRSGWTCRLYRCWVLPSFPPNLRTPHGSCRFSAVVQDSSAHPRTTDTQHVSVAFYVFLNIRINKSYYLHCAPRGASKLLLGRCESQHLCTDTQTQKQPQGNPKTQEGGHVPIDCFEFHLIFTCMWTTVPLFFFFSNIKK